MTRFIGINSDYIKASVSIYHMWMMLGELAIDLADSEEENQTKTGEG